MPDPVMLAAAVVVALAGCYLLAADDVRGFLLLLVAGALVLLAGIPGHPPAVPA